jgi:DNA-binding PadR family transcriptional regulator
VTRRRRLPDSAFVVLALLAEGEAHGYEIQRVAANRGFRFWTDLRRSSIYNALGALERAGLVAGTTESGGGAARRVYRVTRAGRVRLEHEGWAHLARPAHPRSEIDLGIYALPFLPRARVGPAIAECLAHLRAREAFLAERLAWCEAHGLRMPALAFERPLLALRAELRWLDRVRDEHDADVAACADEWDRYVYREPPVHAPDVAAGKAPRPRARTARRGAPE